MTERAEDSFDDLVLDEDFIRAGRREESADERLERLKRIARENAARGGWREGPPVVPGGGRKTRRRKEGRRTGRLVLSLTGVAGVLAAAWYLQDAAGTSLVPEVPGNAPPVAAETPVLPPPTGGPPPRTGPPPERLAPLPAAPAGEGGFRFVQTREDDSAVAWDPCRPVRFVVRPDGQPAGGDALLTEAVGLVAAASGLVFERGTDTDEAPDDRRDLVQPGRYGDGFAPVLVVWSDEQESPDLAGYIAGVAGGQYYGWEDESTWRYVSGIVVLDRDDAQEMLSGPGGAAQLRSTMVHELGHLVGLDHVSDRDQIMFSEGGDNRLQLGDGDRRGLQALGSGACFTDWDELAAGATD